MKKITLLVAFAILSLGTFSSYAENEPDKKDGVERTYEKEVKKDYKKTRDGTVKAYDKTKDGTVNVFNKSKNGTVKVYNKTVDGTKNIFQKVKNNVSK